MTYTLRLWCLLLADRALGWAVRGEPPFLTAEVVSQARELLAPQIKALRNLSEEQKR